jgi:hypothetical protein
MLNTFSMMQLEHDHILARLSEADRIDRLLATRIDDMRKAVDDMGQRLSSQVRPESWPSTRSTI